MTKVIIVIRTTTTIIPYCSSPKKCDKQLLKNYSNTKKLLKGLINEVSFLMTLAQLT